MLDYNAWSEQITGMINGGDMIDAVEWDMRPYLTSIYQDWIAGEILKTPCRKQICNITLT